MLWSFLAIVKVANNFAHLLWESSIYFKYYFYQRSEFFLLFSFNFCFPVYKAQKQQSFYLKLFLDLIYTVSKISNNCKFHGHCSVILEKTIQILSIFYTHIIIQLLTKKSIKKFTYVFIILNDLTILQNLFIN